MSYDVGMQIDTGNHQASVGISYSYTYNVAPMFVKAFSGGEGIYTLVGITGEKAISVIKDAIAYFDTHKDALKLLNPENQWGDFDGARALLVNILEIAKEHPRATVYVF